MQNQLKNTGRLALATATLLVAVSFISKETQIGGWTLKRMDILADIRKNEQTSTAPSPAAASETSPDSSKNLQLTLNSDSAQWGKIIEDFTPEQRGLADFFAAVDDLKIKKNRQVRVAWLGDSFVEGDILIGDLRDTLQTLWGGRGVGFVPMSSEVARFRRSFLQQYSGWTTLNVVKNSDSAQPFGIAGVVSLPAPEASVRYDGNDYFRNTRSWSQVRLFYQSENGSPFVWQNLHQPPKMDSLPAAAESKLGSWQWQGNSFAFAFRFPNPAGLRVFGASLETESGFFLDNFSVRGNSGGRLKKLDPALMQAFDRELKYDLVIVQLGLNAVQPDLRNIVWYEKELDDTFAHLRRCFPKKTILIFSVADRGGKVAGEIRTMPAVPAIVGMQRNLARKHGFLFWDLFRGMGGEGTMFRFSQMRPSLANKDFTHLTHEGGRVMGLLIADFFEKEHTRFAH